ncbi:hypothetical protein GQ54DRAFT_296332 [Martensiomyces pterosporus]|nr:hypothetical protein GQ54DRAFT_296332 [Martensiomyces pterosporus]
MELEQPAHLHLMANIHVPHAELPAGSSSRTTGLQQQAPPIKRSKSSRFSVLLESSVDYTSYRTAYGKQFLQQQPNFDSIEDAEEELKCVLHDPIFAHSQGAGSVMAENVALAADWFISALVLLFDGDEPFQNPHFLRLCCMFFASPLYENNARLVQRHLVKRTYAELNTSDPHKYNDTLWLLLAFLHLITEFQPDTYCLCRDTGLFPLLERAVREAPERHLHVLAMSLMFEIAQAVVLSSTDIDCITDELLLFLLDYVERMRYAESDVYNNTGTKLVLALNEQFLKLDGYVSMPQSPLAFNSSASNGRAATGQKCLAGRPVSTLSAQSMPPLSPSDGSPSLFPASPRVRPISPPSGTSSLDKHSVHGSHLSTLSCHSRSESVDFQAEPRNSCPSYCNTAATAATTAAIAADNGLLGDENAAAGYFPSQPPQPLRHPAVHALPIEAHPISRSRSMDLRAHIDVEGSSLLRSTSETRDQELQRKGPRKPRTSISSTSTLGKRMSSSSTPVVELLVQRADCCKTFTENLVFLLNRETDPATQVLILHMLYCILTDPGTADILYTNDMFVLIDIVIRDLSNLSDVMQRLRQAYLLVASAILRNPVYLTTRHRLSDIELCLVNLLRHSLVCAQVSLSTSAREDGSRPSSSSKRYSNGTNTSTPRMSLAEEGLTVAVPADRSRCGSGIASPTSSLSSSVSEETCCPRSMDDHHSHHSASLPKTPRRPAPPPPPAPRSRHHRAHATQNTQLRPHSRRRPPPPPPPHVSVAHCDQASTEYAEANGMRVHRRRAPPPPPPPVSLHSPPALPPRSAATPHAPPPPLPNRPAGRTHGADAAPAIGSGNTAPEPPQLPRRRKPAATGLRRQLSVKNSVSKYKRNSRPVLPPPRRNDTGTGDSAVADAVAATAALDLGPGHHPVSPIAESFTESTAGHAQPAPPSVDVQGVGTEDEEEDDDEDALGAAASPRMVMGDSTEERRATRKLVETALRCCHEARILAVSKTIVLSTPNQS